MQNLFVNEICSLLELCDISPYESFSKEKYDSLFIETNTITDWIKKHIIQTEDCYNLDFYSWNELEEAVRKFQGNKRTSFYSRAELEKVYMQYNISDNPDDVERFVLRNNPEID